MTGQFYFSYKAKYIATRGTVSENNTPLEYLLEYTQAFMRVNIVKEFLVTLFFIKMIHKVSDMSTVSVCNTLNHVPYECPNLAYQKIRKLRVFYQNLEGNHCYSTTILINIRENEAIMFTLHFRHSVI